MSQRVTSGFTGLQSGDNGLIGLQWVTVGHKVLQGLQG